VALVALVAGILVYTTEGPAPAQQPEALLANQDRWVAAHRVDPDAIRNGRQLPQFGLDQLQTLVAHELLRTAKVAARPK
jgi:hypothetical protein